MAQPAEYVRQQDYSDYQSDNPGSYVNGSDLDADFDAVKTTTDQIRANLALIQRDDGALANDSVHADSLDAAVLALIAATWTPQGQWATATDYAVGDVVEKDDVAYVCAEAHTSGTFSTDDAAGYWVGFTSSATGTNVSFSPTGNIAATDVQAAIEELDTEKQPLDALLTAIAALTTAADKMIYATGSDTVALTDLTAFARTILDDANAAAVRTTLGLVIGTNVLAPSGDGSGLSGIVTVGKQSIWVPAAAMLPAESNGCAPLARIETTAGRPDLQVLDFDTSADEHAQFSVLMPKSWNEGTVTFRAVWTSEGAVTTGVAVGLQAIGVADNESVDQAYGTPVVVTDDAQGAAEEVYITDESDPITIAGTKTYPSLQYFDVFRDVDDGNDDMTQDMRLIGIMLHFTTDAGTDA